jgi:LacI family transcriptional regulator
LKQITIHDIAKSLDITASTVSRALNNHPRISKVTKQKVIDKARELNYSPNTMAANFRRGITNTVGVIVPNINRNFFSNVIGGIEHHLNQFGYNVIIAQTNEEYEKEVKVISAMLKSRVDGIIISISAGTKNFDHIRRLMTQQLPVVFFDRVCPEKMGGSYVVLDDEQGAYNVVKQMINNKGKNIVHLGGPKHVNVYNNRFKGYLRALEESGLEFDPRLVIFDILKKEEGYQAVDSLIQKKIHFDGILAASDFSALGAVLALRNHHVAIPDDVQVSGFANEPFTELLQPSLTSVEQYPLEIGRAAADIMIEKLKSRDADLPDREVVIQPKPVYRDSILS